MLLRGDDHDEGLPVREEVARAVSPVLKSILDGSNDEDALKQRSIVTICSKASIEAFISLAKC